MGEKKRSDFKSKDAKDDTKIVMKRSLYFHLPFCSRKCPYCHFLVLPNDQDLKKKFLPALMREWELRLPLIENQEIVSLYFGGGTPTLFMEGIEAILEKCHPDCEITVETNPEEVTPEMMSRLKGLGVNRVSIGVQSLESTWGALTMLWLRCKRSSPLGRRALKISRSISCMTFLTKR